MLKKSHFFMVLRCQYKGFVWLGMPVAYLPGNLHRLRDEVSVSYASLWRERKIGGPVIDYRFDI